MERTVIGMLVLAATLTVAVSADTGAGDDSSAPRPDEVVKSFIDRLIAKDCSYVGLLTDPAQQSDGSSVGDCEALAAADARASSGRCRGDDEGRPGCRPPHNRYFAGIKPSMSRCLLDLGPPSNTGGKATVALEMTCPDGAPPESAVVHLERTRDQWRIASFEYDD